jgi:hypothetical protein
MVKIRYSELPVGLHVTAEQHGRDTIIYLQPGLSPEQRRAALIRVRSSSRMGHGPDLTPLSMAMAVSADKLRTTLGNGAAAMRGHPLLLLPPLILLVSGAIIFVLMSFVTLTMPQHASAGGTQTQAGVRGSGHGQRIGTGGRPVKPAVDPDSPGQGQGGTTRPPGPKDSLTPSPRLTSAPVPTPSTPRPTSPDPVISGVPSPSVPSATPSPEPSPEPTPSPSQSQGSTCVQVGPLGLCLHF